MASQSRIDAGCLLGLVVALSMFLPLVPSGGRGLFGLGEVGGALLVPASGSTGVAGKILSLPVDASAGLEEAAESDESRKRFAGCAVAASGESLLLGLALENFPSRMCDSDPAPPRLAVLVVGSSGVALYAHRRARSPAVSEGQPSSESPEQCITSRSAYPTAVLAAVLFPAG